MTSVDAQENNQGPLASAISSEVIIDLNKVNKWYGDFHVLKDIDLVVHKGERIVVCGPSGDRKSTRLNSSHVAISYAVFCLKKKTSNTQRH